MGKYVTERYDQGDYVCEWVNEVPPLGKDRKTIFVPDSSPIRKLTSQVEDALAQVRGEGISLAAMIMSVITAKYGQEAWDDVEKMMYEYGRQRAPEFAKTMKIDPKDARSVGRIFDLEDSQYGIKGEWVETGKKRAVKREYYCPMAGGAMLCPEMCSRMFVAVERGTLDGLGVKAKFDIPRLMPKGEPFCEVVLELED
jgi:predicted ArsR family transcriptional regulator